MAEPFDVSRLCQAMQRARLVLRYVREQHVQMVRQYVGAHWSEEAGVKEVPCNLIALYVDIVGKKLIANNPRLMLTTDTDGDRPVVNAMEAWANKQVEKINLAGVLQRCVLNALFSVGIAKVGIAAPSDAAVSGWSVGAGEPFVESIDLDDFIFDVHARSFDQVSYIGHRYRAPLEVAKKMFGKRVGQIEASEDRLYNLEGDERVSVLGRGYYYSDTQEFEDMIDLWEVYLPRHKAVVTLYEDYNTGVMHDAAGRALRVRRWIGPVTGPYHILGFSGVPGNPMPKAPVQDLFDLHNHINVVLRKLIRQAERQKTVGFVSGGADEDGNRAIQTNDGEWSRIDNPDSMKIVEMPGANANNFQLFGAFRDLFTWLAGNLNALGGLSPEAKTLGQDKMLNESASATIDAMQDTVLTFTCDVARSWLWFCYHHPTGVMKSRYSVPGMPEIGVNRSVSPRGGPGMARNGAFEELDLKIDPYSMPRMTPAQKGQALNQMMAQVLLPLAPLMQQQGNVIDVNEYLTLVAKFTNMPELKQIVTLQEPPPAEADTQGPGTPETPGAPKAPETTRNYVRHSQGNASQFGKDLTRANAMTPPNGKAQPQGAGLG